MNPSNAAIDLAVIKDTMRGALASGIGWESLIEEMRKSGLNQLECIKMMRDLGGLSLDEAKEAVHHSNAWADRKEVNQALHETAFRAAANWALQRRKASSLARTMHLGAAIVGISYGFQ